MSSPISEPRNISAPTMPSKSLGICCFFRLPTGSSADGIFVSPHHCSNTTVIPAFQGSMHPLYHKFFRA